MCVPLYHPEDKMKRIFGAIFLAVLIATSICSKEQNVLFADDPSITLETVKERLSNPPPSTDIKPFVSLTTSLASPGPQQTPKAKRQRPTASIALPEYVFKDGAFYMVLAGSNILIPMTGGGASGCFTKGLDQRGQSLKSYVKKLPRKVSF